MHLSSVTGSYFQGSGYYGDDDDGQCWGLS
jgi:hypothetical protein